VLDIRELIRLAQAGESNRAIARVLNSGRNTVAAYRAWAEQHHLLAGDLPSPDVLACWLEQDRVAQPGLPGPSSSVEPHRAFVVDQRARGVEIATIYRRLHEEHGYPGSYGSVLRFVHALEPVTPELTLRIERPPGEEAQVDFGYAGRMLDGDGQARRAWGFVMTLSYSRHQYDEFVFDQRVETWLRLHQRAFEYFGGVPRKIVLDNLKAGIVKACFEDPQVQRAYRECAEHYGFLIAPCRPHRPREKGKVENGVHYVQRSFLAGREPAALTDNNIAVLDWVEHTAGLRDHGTTHWQPLVQFQQVEQAALLPLPATPYVLATWKQVKLHRDCYVHFDRAYYSAPFRYVGQTLWVRGEATRVRVYADHVLVATHPRATAAGQRATQLDHLPVAQADALTLTPERCRDDATRIGTASLEVVTRLLEERPLDRLRSVGSLLRLAETYTPARLERACARALRFETATYPDIKRILLHGLDREEMPPDVVPELPTPMFARPNHELLAGVGGATWTR
jgi:transposase